VQNNRLVATTSARLSALFALLMVGTFAATAFVSWLITREAGRHELEQRIDVEVAALTLEFRTEGLEPVVLAIAARSQRPGALEYRLVAHVATDDLGAFDEPGAHQFALWHPIPHEADDIGVEPQQAADERAPDQTGGARDQHRPVAPKRAALDPTHSHILHGGAPPRQRSSR